MMPERISVRIVCAILKGKSEDEERGTRNSIFYGTLRDMEEMG